MADNSFTLDYIESYPRTIEYAIEAPLQWSAKDWTVAGGVVIGATALYLSDQETQDWIHSNRSTFSHSVADIGNTFGDIKYIASAIGATWLVGYAASSPQTMDTALLSAKTVVLAGATTGVLKFVTQRHRPVSHQGKQFWKDVGFSHRRESFPSGHTTLAFALSSVLAEQYKEQEWVAPVVYGTAAITSYSRMHDEKHWASDVFVGAVIGYVCGKLVCKTTPRITINPTPTKVEVGYQF